jgi:hypothetical protein
VQHCTLFRVHDTLQGSVYLLRIVKKVVQYSQVSHIRSSGVWPGGLGVLLSEPSELDAIGCDVCQDFHSLEDS